MADADDQLINGPEAFTPDGEFILGESDVRGSSSLPGSVRTASPALAATARSSPSGSSVASRRWTCGRWTSAASATSTGAGLQPGVHVRGVQHVLRHRVPQPRAAGRAAAAVPPAYARHVDLGAEFGEKSGWERVQLVPLERGPGARGPRPPAGQASTGRRRSSPSTSRAATTAGLFDESSFAKIVRCPGVGAVEFLQRMCTNNVDKKPGSITYTQMLNSQRGHRVRLHGHPPRGRSFHDRHRHCVRTP